MAKMVYLAFEVVWAYTAAAFLVEAFLHPANQGSLQDNLGALRHMAVLIGCMTFTGFALLDARR